MYDQGHTRQSSGGVTAFKHVKYFFFFFFFVIKRIQKNKIKK
jgi:hypothetical protein